MTTVEGAPQRLAIRDAASVVIVDREGPEPRILAGRRGSRHVFMANMLVFPGGRIDRSDLALAGDFSLAPEGERRLNTAVGSRFNSRRGCALALAAIRETFEETGIMLGRREDRFASTAAFWRDFAAQGVTPEPEALVPFARAITPPRNTRRYDTRFFAVSAEAIAHRLFFDQRPTDEFTSVDWLTLSEMKAADLAFITRKVLDDFVTRLDAGTLFDARQPMPFYRQLNGRFRRDII